MSYGRYSGNMRRLCRKADRVERKIDCRIASLREENYALKQLLGGALFVAYSQRNEGTDAHDLVEAVTDAANSDRVYVMSSKKRLED